MAGLKWQRSGGVAIPMQLTGDLEKTINAVPLLPFDERVLDLLNDLSKRLIKVREHSDVATFGFWCRKTALLKRSGIMMTCISVLAKASFSLHTIECT